MKKFIRAEQFVRVWQTSKTLSKVCSRLNVSKRWASEKAGDYRKKRKIPLKRFGRFGLEWNETIDWAKLRHLAVKLQPKL